MKYEVVYPNGQRETLLWVPKFNFNWQTVYRLRAPLTIPRGSRMIITAHFDNSANNPRNPDPAAEVRYGQQSWEEMMIGFFDVAVPAAMGKTDYFVR